MFIFKCHLNHKYLNIIYKINYKFYQNYFKNVMKLMEQIVLILYRIL